jgi:uncharacterized protein
MTTLKTFIKKHSVLIYLLLTFIISWGGALLAIGGFSGLPATTEEANKLLPFIILVTLAGPSVAGILLTSLVYGRPGLRELLAHFRRRVGGRWYIVALLTAPVVVTVILLALSLLSVKFLPSIITTGDKTSLLLTGITYGLAAGLFEELGWTGFAVPKLRRRYSVLTTGLLVGLAWGMWHFFVAIWGSGDSSGAFSLALFLPWISWNLAVLPVFRVLMVWVYERTDSLLIGMLMHASLTASLPLILMPAVTGVDLFTFYLILAVALWVVVAVIAISNGGQLSRQPLQRQTAKVATSTHR